MYTLPFEAVTEWVNRNYFWLPRSVDFICPHSECGRKVNFALDNWQHHTLVRSAVAIATCPGCHKEVSFFVIGAAKFGDTGRKECEELCMHPTPKLHHRPMRGLDNIPEPIARAYISAVNVFNAREWNATAMLVGRALEGLAKHLMPEDKKHLSLAQMLAEMPTTIDLTETLKTLTDGLRKGRNLGAHFDLQKEADEEVARMMIEFIEYFLEYLYILPREVKELHDRL